MKKSWKIGLICGGALLILIALAGVGLWFFLSSGAVEDLRYANEERYSVGAAVLPDTIHTLKIHWAEGEVKVETYQGKEILIEEEGAEKEEDELRYLSRGGILDIRFRKSERVFGSLPEKVLTVRIPDAMAKELSDVEIESVGANVSLMGLEGRECSVESVSGNVLVNSATFQSVSLENVSGKTEFEGFTEKAEVETVSGNVILCCPTPPERVEFSSVSGDLNLATQGDERGFSVELETVSGNFSSQFPTETKNGRFVHGEGGNRYEAETVSGNVKIEAMDSPA